MRFQNNTLLNVQNLHPFTVTLFSQARNILSAITSNTIEPTMQISTMLASWYITSTSLPFMFIWMAVNRLGYLLTAI